MILFRLIKELNHWKENKDSINIIANILDGEESKAHPLISPCFGDPNNRDVLSGGWIQKNYFQKINDKIVASDGQCYIKGGPRYHIAVDAVDSKACIVTSGGLTPGLNVVIRELVMALRYNYGVPEVWGVRFGFQGFMNPDFWVKLEPEQIKEIHQQGGSILGVSRGPFDCEGIIKELTKRKINLVFFIGGDGTHKAIAQIYEGLKKEKLEKKIILAGIAKSLENDIPIIDRSFGLESAVQESKHIISAANVEANCNLNGISIVKLAGKTTGFIPMYATLAARDVNICLIPEVPFNLYGENGLLDFLFQRIKIKEHCVMVIGEGSGYAFMDYGHEENKGNGKSSKTIEKLKEDLAQSQKKMGDIGVLLKKEIIKKSEELGIDVSVKLIDTTYMIRAIPANSYDCNLCAKLAESAVHCAFAGYTNFTVGMINNHPCMIPINKITASKRKVEQDGEDYLMLLASTGQPSFYPNVCLDKTIEVSNTNELQFSDDDYDSLKPK